MIDKVKVEVVKDDGSGSNDNYIKIYDAADMYSSIIAEKYPRETGWTEVYARVLYYSVERISALESQRDELLKALKGFHSLALESRGVAGYHLNGDIAEWDDLDDYLWSVDLVKKIEADL